MQTYSEFSPTPCDSKGLALEDRQDWLVVVGRNRDSNALARSNWRVILADLGGESDDVEIHRFGHWACGWLEVLIVRPESAAAKSAAEWEAALSDYPVASDEDCSREEQEEAEEIWRTCYRPVQRIEYIRENRSQFEFQSFADMLGCVRGNYFAGYASELIG